MANEDEAKRLYDRALSAWGREAQMRMLQEECGELIVAINQWGRDADANSEDNAMEKIVDVEIMLGQVRAIFRDEWIYRVKASKLERLKERLDSEYD